MGNKKSSTDKCEGDFEAYKIFWQKNELYNYFGVAVVVVVVDVVVVVVVARRRHNFAKVAFQYPKNFCLCFVIEQISTVKLFYLEFSRWECVLATT